MLTQSGSLVTTARLHLKSFNVERDGCEVVKSDNCEDLFAQYRTLYIDRRHRSSYLRLPGNMQVKESWNMTEAAARTGMSVDAKARGTLAALILARGLLSSFLEFGGTQIFPIQNAATTDNNAIATHVP
jgi:hypothetical protein